MTTLFIFIVVYLYYQKRKYRNTIKSNKMTTLGLAIAEAKTSAFVNASKKERKTLVKLFNTLGVTDYEFSPENGMDRWDFKFTLNGIDYIGDVKCRNIKHDAYKDSLIDKSKLDFLIEEGKNENRVPLIIVSYSDDVICSWNLSKINIKYTQKYCNRTTAVSTGKRMKDVGLLLLTDAKTHKTA